MGTFSVRPWTSPAWTIKAVKEEGGSYEQRPTITEPEHVVALLSEEIRNEDREMFMVLGLDVKHKVIGVHMVSVGTLTEALVSPREVLKFLILTNSARGICVHNHPSGNPEPSEQDRGLTLRLQEAGKIMNIPILDHVILGDGAAYSFERGGLI